MSERLSSGRVSPLSGDGSHPSDEENVAQPLPTPCHPLPPPPTFSAQFPVGWTMKDLAASSQAQCRRHGKGSPRKTRHTRDFLTTPTAKRHQSKQGHKTTGGQRAAQTRKDDNSAFSVCERIARRAERRRRGRGRPRSANTGQGAQVREECTD